MATRRLNRNQTRARLRELGIDRAPLPAFAFAEDARRLSYDWHTHRQHQLLYSVRGTARLQSKFAQFLLPPQRAAWIPAGTRHATHVNGAEIVSIYFNRSWAKARELQVFEVPPLLREMVLYARRWPIVRGRKDAHATAFFRALVGVIGTLTHRAPAYELPRARTELTRAAMTWVLGHLETSELGAAAKHCGTTPRTLRRRFLAETGLHFRAFVLQARMQRAMELLGEPSRSIVEVALDVGFRSQSAFAQAFRRVTGQAPRDFRKAAAGAAT